MQINVSMKDQSAVLSFIMGDELLRSVQKKCHVD